MSQDEREEEGGWDPFALGGYAEEDERAADFAREVSQGSAKPVRQGSLFRFALEAIERRRVMADPRWERPNPSRLNDTSAIVRKGTYPYALKTSAYCDSMPCETPFIPENTFNKRGPDVAICGPYGAGLMVGMRRRGNGGRGGSPDRDVQVPGAGNSLAGGVSEVKKSGGRV